MKKITILFYRFFLLLVVLLLFFTHANAQFSVVIVVTANASSCSACDGSATANPIGGTPPYMFSWVPTSSTLQTVTGFCPGQIGVLVSDASGFAGDTAIITCPAAGVNEISMNYLLQISPNPASEEVNIKLLSQNSSITAMSVINTLGEIVINKQFNNGNGFDNILFIGNLPKGIYIVELRDKNYVYRKKLIKQ